MSEEIKVPGFGESVTEAVVVNILKPSGSIVKEDEEILELESEKVNQVVHAPAAGKLELSVNVNDTVKIGQVIGKIETGAKASAEAEKAPPKEEKKTAPAPKEEKPAPAPAPAKKEAPAPSKETARRTPEEFVKKTEEKAQPEEKPIKPAPKEGKERRERMTGLRKTIARRLVEVKNQTAMLTTFNEVDMSAVMAIRAKEKEKFEKRFGVKLGFMSFFVKASIAALKAFPEINAYIEGDEIIYPSGYHIGVAVSTEKGLFVPVIKQAQDLSYADIEKQLIEYAKQAREGKISMDALKGGTFTITNGGVFGSLLSTPILNPPQSGILGMHAIVKRPVAVGDKVEIRPMMYLALSYDHRVVDGKEAVSFLVHMKENLEDPARQLLDF